MNDVVFGQIVSGADAFGPDDIDASSFAVVTNYGDFADLVLADLVARVDSVRLMELT